MKIWILSFFLIPLIFFSCKKDKYTTEPQVTVKSISPGQVLQGDILMLDAKFTDDEGDIDSTLIVYKWFDVDAVTITMVDTFRYSLSGLKIPGKLRQGDLSVQFEYGSTNNQNGYPTFSSVTKDATASFGLVLIDKASHRSNYSESGKIRLLKP